MRALTRVLAIVGAAAAALIAAVWIVNRPAFDQNLLNELEALKVARAPALEQNAYPLAMGFMAPTGADPEAAGREVIAALEARYKAGQALAISPQERITLGRTGEREDWQVRLTSLECVPRVDLDCADRLIAEMGRINLGEPRLVELSRRFQALLKEQTFDEGQQRDFDTPYVAYTGIRDLARIILADSIQRESESSFIARALEHLRFWKLILRDGQTLADKMVAVAGIQDSLDFLSALMRARALKPEDARVIENGVNPLTPRELDISDAFLSEARMYVLSPDSSLAGDAPWYLRLALERNASLNAYYDHFIRPMLVRAKLNPAEFYRTGGNRPLEFAPERAPFLFNWGGNILIRHMAWDPWQFPARTQDQNGRLTLVALQAELERTAETEREAVIRASSHRNPYTGEPMHYDAASATIGFPCMHTAYHPPAQPDHCAVRIARMAE